MNDKEKLEYIRKNLTNILIIKDFRDLINSDGITLELIQKQLLNCLNVIVNDKKIFKNIM